MDVDADVVSDIIAESERRRSLLAAGMVRDIELLYGAEVYGMVEVTDSLETLMFPTPLEERDWEGLSMLG